LKPSTATKIAAAGASASHGAISRYWKPTCTIEPHDGVGGCAPSPMKLRLDSVMIAKPTPSAACTIAGLIALGSTWRKMIARRVAPIERAAAT
jgi:hypothetical protein